MKRINTFFTLAIAILLVSAAEVNAQQRRDRDRNTRDGKERRDRDHHDDHKQRGKWNHDKDKWNNWDSHDTYARRGHAHRHRPVRSVSHYHSRHCEHRPIIVHRHYNRPRYIYYRDYDVYYDCHRNVYISYSGRSWTMATEVPVGMRHQNLRQVKRFKVDYYDDDFVGYLETGRPEYGDEWND